MGFNFLSSLCVSVINFLWDSKDFQGGIIFDGLLEPADETSFVNFAADFWCLCFKFKISNLIFKSIELTLLMPGLKTVFLKKTVYFI
jgi:hypothetical protein